MWIENQTADQDQVKICLYKVDDSVDWIPVGAGVFTVAMGENHHWEAPAGEGLDAYHIIAFHPQFFDKRLCDVNHAPTGGHFVVRGGGGTYALMQVAEVPAP
jgi:hypothetical protein